MKRKATILSFRMDILVLKKEKEFKARWEEFVDALRSDVQKNFDDVDKSAAVVKVTTLTEPTAKRKPHRKRSETLMEIFEREGFSTEEIKKNKDLLDKL